MYNPTILLLTTTLLSLLASSQQPDGLIVPFSSTLPSCAAQCGPLYDAQGACAPSVLASTSSSCFCAYRTLQPFLTTTAGVCDNACTTDANGLTEIRNWFLGYCGKAVTTTSSSAGSTATATSGASSGASSQGSLKSSGHTTWFGTHYKWVIMAIVLVLAISILWIGAFLLRRRYIRKKEKEIEMRPPVAWGPHQLQGMTGGYNYGDGVVDARGGAAGRGKEKGGKGKAADVSATPSNAEKVQEKKERKSKGWLTKDRA